MNIRIMVYMVKGLALNRQPFFEDTIMIFFADSIADYKAKIAAIKTLELEVANITLVGYWSNTTDAQYAENVKNAKWYANYANEEFREEYDNDVRFESWYEVESVGNKWVQIKSHSGLNKYDLEFRFPINPQLDSYKRGEEARIRIETKHKF